MKRLTFFFLIFLFGTSCNQSKKDNCNFVVTQFYPTGKIQNILSLNNDSIKNGECFYFSEHGFLDSSVTFSNGILQGVKRIYYDNGTYTYRYKNGNLISHCEYDSLNNLLYKTPIDVNEIGKTKITFFSGRNYFNQDKCDSITVTNEGLPLYNKRISVTGAILGPLQDSSFTIRALKHHNDFTRIVLKVFARQNIRDTTEKGILIDSTIIPVK
jgi:hypothetical protein